MVCIYLAVPFISGPLASTLTASFVKFLEFFHKPNRSFQRPLVLYLLATMGSSSVDDAIIEEASQKLPFLRRNK
jgi:hypothetical protein